MTDWYEDADSYHLPTYDRIPIHFERGEGVFVYDGDGNRYLDALAGIAVNVLGYQHPRLVDAARKAANGIHHISNLFYIEPQYKLSKKLTEFGFDAASFFCNSGAEANEAAIKFARKYATRNEESGKKILTFENSFHGRTSNALAATGQTKYQEGFDPLPSGFEYCEYNNISSLERIMDDSFCAVMLEPIQGEGGIIPADSDFLTTVRRVCDRHDALLIIDEIQAGMGRTGEFFGFQHVEDLTPDLVTLAKGMAGGFPLGGLLVKADISDQGFQSSDHASTFGGNPFVTKMGLRTLKIIEHEGLISNARTQGTYIKNELNNMCSQYECMNEVRGQGLMLGISMNETVENSAIMDAAREKGLIVGIAGDNTIRVVPPLIITRSEAKSLVTLFERTIKTF